MKKILAVLALALAAAIPAHALDGVSGEVGTGDRGVSMARLGAHWRQPLRWLPQNVKLHWELSVARWDAEPDAIYDLGVTPVFRYTRAERGPYLEAAIGAHYLTGMSVHPEAPFSTRFQFGDHIGIGYRGSRYDVGVRLQHLSNAGIRDPNPGVNFVILRIARELK